MWAQFTEGKLHDLVQGSLPGQDSTAVDNRPVSHCGTSTDVTSNINKGSALLKCITKPRQCDTEPAWTTLWAWIWQINGIQPQCILIFTTVLCLLWHVKMSSVIIAYSVTNKLINPGSSPAMTGYHFSPIYMFSLTNKSFIASQAITSSLKLCLCLRCTFSSFIISYMI